MMGRGMNFNLPTYILQIFDWPEVFNSGKNSTFILDLITDFYLRLDSLHNNKTIGLCYRK
jgi:hypothetical protein